MHHPMMRPINCVVHDKQYVSLTINLKVCLRQDMLVLITNLNV